MTAFGRTRTFRRSIRRSLPLIQCWAVIATLLGNAHHLAEHTYEILHPLQYLSLGLLVQRLVPDHPEQGLLRHIAVLLVIVADVERQKPRHVGKLALGCLVDQLVGEASLGEEVVGGVHAQLRRGIL